MTLGGGRLGGYRSGQPFRQTEDALVRLHQLVILAYDNVLKMAAQAAAVDLQRLDLGEAIGDDVQHVF